jgi:hypothetical protein
MSPREDLMERLAKADPLPDAERLTPDEQREAEALLARLVAEPVPERRRHTARSPRRWALVAVGAACAALVALAALDLLDSDAPGPNVVELAVAAVSDGDSVYHVVERRRAFVTDTEPQRSGVFQVESWHTTDGRLHQKVFAGGSDRLLSEFAGRRTPDGGGRGLYWDAESNTIAIARSNGPRDARGAPALEPFDDAGARLREFEREGRLRVAGSLDVDGRRAHRLVSGTVEGFVPGSEERVVFLVDAETYLPIAMRFEHVGENGGEVRVFIRYLRYERLPLDARSRAQLDLDPHPGATCTPRMDACPR